MKKLSILAFAVIVFSDLACATSICSSGFYTTVTALNAGGGCFVGEVLFSNFAGLPTNVAVEFLGGGSSSTLDLVDDTVGDTGIQSFSGFTYTVSIYTPNVPVPDTGTITGVIAGMLDSGGKSTAKLNKELNGGTTAGVNEATATDTGGTITNVSVTSGLAAATLGITDNFTLTSGNVANLSNQYNVTNATPEPVSMLLFGSGLVALFFSKRISCR